MNYVLNRLDQYLLLSYDLVNGSYYFAVKAVTRPCCLVNKTNLQRWRVRLTRRHYRPIQPLM